MRLSPLGCACLLAVTIGAVARAQSSPSREYIHFGSKTVVIENGSGTTPPSGSVGLRVWPSTISLSSGQSQQLNPVVTGTTNTQVSWSVYPSIGSLSSTSGTGPVTYTAPTSNSNSQVVQITARSIADPAKAFTVNVTLYSPQLAGDYPLMGSFLNFYRSMPAALWAKEFDWMQQISINTIVVVAVGGLRPDSSHSTGYSLSGEGLLYPSNLIDPSLRPTDDFLEMLLTFADQRGIKVYIGSLQTYDAWFTGAEFDALRTFNKLVAAEVVQRYGHHPSLEGWYFTQELWMNWVKYYVAQTGSYYGTTLLQNFVTDMRDVDPGRPVAAAVVFKKDPDGAMPGLTPTELQTTTQSFLQTSGLQILMPQDGAGAEAGAPPIAELPQYFAALKNAATSAALGTVLWSTVETFTAAANLYSSQYPPSTAVRVQNQVNLVRPYVSGYVSWIYGDNMSPQATYYPVEASRLTRDYQSRSKPSQFPQQNVLAMSYNPAPAPSPYYPDTSQKLGNRTGGGYNDYGLTTWAGFRVEDSAGSVQVVADLGSAVQLAKVRLLTLSMTNSGIHHPQSVRVEVSTNGQNYTTMGTSTPGSPDTYYFSVGWTEQPCIASARYVRFTFSHVQWLFLGEVEILGPPTIPTPPTDVSVTIDPASVQLMAQQTQQFTATVTVSTNTAVTWQVIGGTAYGTIDQQGIYQAPASVASIQNVQIKATSVADQTKFGYATVQLQPNPTGTPSGLMVGPVTPDSGSGLTQLFRFEARPRSGQLTLVQVIINSDLSGANACFLAYDPGANIMTLYLDAGGASVPVTPGTQSPPLANNECSIDVRNSSVTPGPSGSLSLNLSMSFASSWNGAKAIYMWAQDTAGNVQTWTPVGYWTVP